MPVKYVGIIINIFTKTKRLKTVRYYYLKRKIEIKFGPPLGGHAFGPCLWSRRFSLWHSGCAELYTSDYTKKINKTMA